MSAQEVGAAIARGVDYLVATQLPSGEMPSYATPLGDAPPEWIPDPLNFVTALCAEALDSVADPRASDLVDRSVRFLLSQQLPGGLWRYWSTANERVEFTPPDADDTACCSLAVACRGHDTSANRSVLLATAAPDGRFHTWLIPRPDTRSFRVRWLLRRERRPEVRALRTELWASTEADPDDIDAVVNANVCRYLGPRDAPEGATAWVAEVVEAGWETHDKWYRRPYALLAAVAHGAERGIERFVALEGTVVERIDERVDELVDRGRDLDRALALLALERFGVRSETADRLAAALVASQGPDGAWARDVVYFGGPTEVFGWGSEALTTAYALQGLSARR
ncbi:MAG: hypothetical protein U0Q22_02605 [Acidimicrobiales bacterium]